MLAAGPETGRIRASVEHQVELSAENLWEEISGRLREALSDGTLPDRLQDVLDSRGQPRLRGLRG